MVSPPNNPSPNPPRKTVQSRPPRGTFCPNMPKPNPPAERGYSGRRSEVLHGRRDAVDARRPGAHREGRAPGAPSPRESGRVDRSRLDRFCGPLMGRYEELSSHTVSKLKLGSTLWGSLMCTSIVNYTMKKLRQSCARLHRARKRRLPGVQRPNNEKLTLPIALRCPWGAMLS